jgi:hypothetical protein
MPVMQLPIVYVQADLPQGMRHLVTCCAAERLSRGERLPSELIMGILLEPTEDFTAGIKPENFGVNAAFVHFLHQVIGECGPLTEKMHMDAGAIENGKLYVIDERSPRPQPGQPRDVWDEDLIGEFDVKDGFIVKGSYRRNPVHRVLSSIGQGFIQLEEELMKCLVSEFNDLPEPEGDFIAGEFGHIQ